jgi:hypothetical protein
MGARLALVTVTATLVAGCSSPPPNTSANGSPAPVTVTSTLVGLSTLPARVYWEAFPSVPATQISQVDFLIDGQVWWDDRTSPYVYGAAGNWLVTSSLMLGKHTFTVGFFTLNNQVSYAAVSTVIATVAAPPAPPGALAGKWARTVTAADLQKAVSYPLPLPGDWQLTIGPAGWGLVDPHGNYRLFDVAYAVGVMDMRPTIETPDSSKDGFCSTADFGYVDPIWSWGWETFAHGQLVRSGGGTLLLQPQGLDPCGNRAAVLEGYWRLVNTP